MNEEGKLKKMSCPTVCINEPPEVVAEIFSSTPDLAENKSQFSAVEPSSTKLTPRRKRTHRRAKRFGYF